MNTLTELEKRLEEIGPVNLNAQSLFNTVTDKKEALRSRCKEYEKSLKKNGAVLEQLMATKDEKVEFTFTQVAKYFSEVFTILVPNGHARLIFDRFAQSQVDETNNNRPSAIRIEVSFNGNDEVTELNALSGGQKSIVALAYMFALQKCDPCPIYIFDEIDSNLDTRSRKAIANWLVNCKEDGIAEEETQFITTTFRRELMERADKIIGVTMMRKASQVQVLDRQEGLDFITQFCTEPMA